MQIPKNDVRLLHRFLDGELAGDEAAACRARLEREPLLRQGLQELQDRARGFAIARTTGVVAPAGFTAGVLAAVRRLPDREALRAAEVGPDLVVLCRRLLLAAAILFGIGLLWQSGLFVGRSTDTLQATPSVIDREMQRLDAIIQSGIGEPGSGATGARGERQGK